jgi:methylglutaconyl-CoA hydratase
VSERLVLSEDLRPGVRAITFNRPDKRNAFNTALLEQFGEALRAANADPSVRVIILRGAGPVFSAGMDLVEARDTSTAARSAELAHAAMRALMHSPKATIAAAHGSAMAGGAGFVLACDVAIIAEDFQTGFPEVRRGLVAALIMTFIRRKLPEARARELLLTGRIIGAAEALAWGMVNRVVPPDRLMAEAEAFALAFLKAAPNAISRTKALFDELYHLPVGEHLDLARKINQEMRGSDEAQEGMSAFQEKRLPAWDPEAGAAP